MDEVELVFVATNYLKELGYKINENNIIAKDKIVSFSNIEFNKRKNDSKNNIIISDIDVFIDKNIVLVMETTSSFLFNNMTDFYLENNSNLSEKITSTKYSFTKNKDKVLSSCNKIVTNLFNGDTINKVSNNYMKSIEVDQDYQLTDGYPYKKNDKKLIKE